ncbi:MAG: DotI/IcmL family type IV secretion protein [Legionella sp.]|uniref:DotI/IcmL family type IV secretion protein n=1 Tax=Legionella sp. TaxID=459 RepID=UPI0039E601F9
MNKKLQSFAFLLLSVCSQWVSADPEQAPIAVWVNEAIVATYSFSYKNYLQEQKQIAKYFTANAWIAYTKALNDSKLPDAVQANLYYVSAVATEPPVITPIDATHWKANMKLLVLYQNAQYKQRQNLKVTIHFTVAPSGQGVRGYSITNLQSIVTSPPCQCPIEDETETPSSSAATPAGAK